MTSISKKPTFVSVRGTWFCIIQRTGVRRSESRSAIYRNKVQKKPGLDTRSEDPEFVCIIQTPGFG